jgi:hypothetical protein
VRISDHVGPEVLVEVFGHVLLLFSGEVDLPVSPVLIRVALVVLVVELGRPDNGAGLGRGRHVAELVGFGAAFGASIKFFVATAED